MDIKRQQIIEEALNFVSNKGWIEHINNNNFLDLLAKFLGELFEIDYVLIDKYSLSNPNFAETVSFYSKGTLLPIIKYELINTPCENVIGRKLCCHEKNIKQLFPKDHILNEMDVESYIGIPLWSSSGNPIGLIAIMDKNPLTDAKTMELVLQIVAIKAAHELEKLLYENELKIKNKELIESSVALSKNLKNLKRTKEKAEEQEIKYKAIFNQSPLGIALINSETGEFQEMNVRHNEISGRTGSCTERNSWKNFTHPEDIPTIMEKLNLLKKEKIQQFQCEKRNIMPNGEIRWVNLTVVPIISSSLKDKMHLAMVEDITVRKSNEIKLEKELAKNKNLNEALRETNIKILKAKEKAEESDRLKSTFLANMSHEIRTPMSGILGFTDLLLRPDLSSENKDNYIKIVQQSGQRMLNTVNDLIEISEIEANLISYNPEEIDSHILINELFDFFKPEAEKKGLKFIVENNISNKKKFKLDKYKLDSIISNLIKNAIKFTPSGEIGIGYSINNSTFECYVKDTGIGIAPERHKAIFNRFDQANYNGYGNYDGTGLGLSISKSYVEFLGGKIWLESAVGEGSKFYFTLPVATDN